MGFDEIETMFNIIIDIKGKVFSYMKKKGRYNYSPSINRVVYDMMRAI